MVAEPARTLKVRVVPGSSKPRVEEQADGTFKVHVAASPDKGKANAEMVRALAGHLGVSKGAITIVRGHASREKVLKIEAG